MLSSDAVWKYQNYDLRVNEWYEEEGKGTMLVVWQATEVCSYCIV